MPLVVPYYFDFCVVFKILAWEVFQLGQEDSIIVINNFCPVKIMGTIP